MKITAFQVAEIVFQMIRVPTPKGTVQGIELNGDTVTFRYEDGTTEDLHQDQMVEVAI